MSTNPWSSVPVPSAELPPQGLVLLSARFGAAAAESVLVLGSAAAALAAGLLAVAVSL